MNETTLENRIEFLSQIFCHGGVEMCFDANTSSIIIATGDEAIQFPARHLKHIAGALMRLEMNLFLTGITE